MVGGTTGSGIILLSLLMAAGLQGGNVIATDALISIVISLIKLAVFGSRASWTRRRSRWRS